MKQLKVFLFILDIVISLLGLAAIILQIVGKFHPEIVILGGTMFWVGTFFGPRDFKAAFRADC